VWAGANNVDVADSAAQLVDGGIERLNQQQQLTISVGFCRDSKIL
jgi:hypothetical protein